MDRWVNGWDDGDGEEGGGDYSTILVPRPKHYPKRTMPNFRDGYLEMASRAKINIKIEHTKYKSNTTANVSGHTCTSMNYKEHEPPLCVVDMMNDKLERQDKIGFHICTPWMHTTCFTYVYI